MKRILGVMARLPMRKCVGVELFESLCQQARANAMRLRGRKAPIEIICQDVCAADLSEGTIYFMFNPFGPDTMRDALANIHQPLVSNPRTVTVIYYNSVHEEVLQSCGWLVKYHEFATIGGLRVNFWKNSSRDAVVRGE